MRISDGSSDVCSSDLLAPGISRSRHQSHTDNLGEYHMHKRPLLLNLFVAAGVSMAVAAPASAQRETGEEAFAKARNAMIAELADDPAAWRIEPQSYDLTLVVFTDYHHPLCRQKFGSA